MNDDTASGTTADASHPFRGPNDPGLGHALISTVEPDRGFGSAYSRWLDDYHFFDGVMHAPWVFSGRRWHAPEEMLRLRHPDPSPVVSPVEAGRYLNTFWIVPGRLADYLDWAASPDVPKVEDEAVRQHRTHVYTAFHDHVGTVASSEHVPSGQFSLIDPAPGLVLQTFDAPDREARRALQSFLLDDHLPARIIGNPHIMSATLFAPASPPSGLKPEVIAAANRVSNDGTRVTVVWFLATDPRNVWDDHFADRSDPVADAGVGTTTLVAPFLPFRMGVGAE